MNRWRGAAALIVAVVCFGCDSNNGQEKIVGIAQKNDIETAPTVETTEAYSYTPPAGWHMFPSQVTKYRMAIGPPVGGMAPSISVEEAAFSGSVADYAKQMLGPQSFMSKVSQNMQVLKEDEFQTASGAEAHRVVLERSLNGAKMRLTLYFFGKGDKKLVVTCSTRAEGGEALDPTLEASMATFRVAGE